MTAVGRSDRERAARFYLRDVAGPVRDWIESGDDAALVRANRLDSDLAALAAQFAEVRAEAIEARNTAARESIVSAARQVQARLNAAVSADGQPTPYPPDPTTPAEALQTLAAFGRTAPERLPGRVDEALRIADAEANPQAALDGSNPPAAPEGSVDVDAMVADIRNAFGALDFDDPALEPAIAAIDALVAEVRRLRAAYATLDEEATYQHRLVGDRCHAAEARAVAAEERATTAEARLARQTEVQRARRARLHDRVVEANKRATEAIVDSRRSDTLKRMVAWAQQRAREEHEKRLAAEKRLAEVEARLAEALDGRERVSCYELMASGGEWLGAARSWLQRHTRNGVSVTWGSDDVIENHLTVAQIERLASEVAAAAMRPQPSERTLSVRLRARWEAERERDAVRTQLAEVTAERDAALTARGAAEAAMNRVALTNTTIGADLRAIGEACGIRDDEYPLKAVQRVVAELHRVRSTLGPLVRAYGEPGTPEQQRSLAITIADACVRLGIGGGR